MFFFFNDTATTEIYTLSLHDALPILALCVVGLLVPLSAGPATAEVGEPLDQMETDGVDWNVDRTKERGTKAKSSSSCTDVDRKSTRLNSSHANISYAVFCLKKKKYTL